MNQNIKNFIEEGVEDFEKDLRQQLISGFVLEYPKVVEMYKLLKISIIKMIVEEIIEIQKLPYVTMMERLDTISSKLKELTDGK